MATVEILGINIEVDDSQLGKLQEGLGKAGVATNALGTESGQAAEGTKNLANAQQVAGGAAAEHGGKQQTLAQMLGSSRAQTGFLVRELASMSGVTGTAMTAINALTSGLGPVGIALTGLATAAKLVSDHMEEMAKKEIQLATIQAGGAAAITMRTKQVTDSLTKQIDAQSRVVAEERANANALIFIGGAREDELKQLAKEEGKLRVLIKALDDYKSGAIGAAGGTDGLASAADEGARAYYEFTNAVYASQQALEIGGKSSAPKLFGSDQFEKTVIDYKAASDAIQADAVARNRKLEAADAAALDKAIANATRTAETMADFSKEGAAVVAVYGEQGKQAFDMIANSALSASEKVAALNMWESRLPANIRQQIEIYLAANGDALLMQLLGGGGLGGGGLGGVAGGNQQGPQELFTLWGESLETQQRFLDANANNRDKAAREWTKQHLKEVEIAITNGFDMTGRRLTEIEKASGAAFIAAYNDPTNTSHDPYAANSDDPKYKPPKYGTAPGDYTGDKSGMGAASGGGGSVVNVYAAINNGMDVAELEYRLEQIMRRRGN